MSVYISTLYIYMLPAMERDVMRAQRRVCGCVRERVRALLSAGADAAAGARVLLYDAVRRRVL